MTNHRKGRRANHYTTSWGETITGLCLRASNGRFYPVGRNDVSFGSDEKLAVHRFKRWRAENGKPEPIDPDFGINFGLGSALSAERERLRQLILNDPRQAALELNIPHLAWYPPKPEKPEFTLLELNEAYLENKRNKQGKPLDPKYQSNSRRWWKEFLDCVQVPYARDITSSMIRAYHAKVMEAFDSGSSPAYVKSRFAAVKTTFSYGLQYTEDKAEYRRVSDLCLILKAPAEVIDPHPISPEDFNALYDAADIRMKAVLMLGLNMAGHSGEVGKLLRSEIDLDKGTLACRRSKTSRARVAKLWPRTIRDIKRYWKEKPHHAATVFVSRTGLPLTASLIGQGIQTLRSSLKLPDDVNFEGIRDAAYGIAEQVDPHYVKYLAGHKTGMNDKYVLRLADNPRIIACCEAIESAFFGGK